MTAHLEECPRCGVDSKLRFRTFSAQALVALITWEEVEGEATDNSYCDHCYQELREILMERADELATISMTPPAKKSNRVAPAKPKKKPEIVVAKPMPSSAKPMPASAKPASAKPAPAKAANVKPTPTTKPVANLKSVTATKPANSTNTKPAGKGKPTAGRPSGRANA